MPKKHTYEYVKEYIENERYKLISTEYINNYTKLEIQCPEGHIFQMRYNDFQKGYRCNVCGGTKRLTFEYVKDFIEDEGYKLLSTEYKNAQTKLEIQCSKGHIFEMRYNSFNQGRRCPDCYENTKPTYKQVKQIIENEGYKLLSTEYKKSSIKLEIQCPSGHLFQMRYNSFNQGRRCPECYGSKKHTYKQVKQNIEDEGYKLLSTEYVNVKSRLKIQCPEGHIFEIRYDSFQQGTRCSVCNAQKQSSKAEKDIVQYVSSIYNGTIVENDRNTIVNHLTGMNLELDILLPDINKAIEYNGTYWHSDRYQKIKDKIKRDQCKELGIDLLVIDEKLWTQDKSSCLNQVRDHII
jgi:signal recognition particle subunit SEC65